MEFLLLNLVIKSSSFPTHLHRNGMGREVVFPAALIGYTSDRHRCLDGKHVCWNWQNFDSRQKAMDVGKSTDVRWIEIAGISFKQVKKGVLLERCLSVEAVFVWIHLLTWKSTTSSFTWLQTFSYSYM